MESVRPEEQGFVFFLALGQQKNKTKTKQNKKTLACLGLGDYKGDIGFELVRVRVMVRVRVKVKVKMCQCSKKQVSSMFIMIIIAHILGPCSYRVSLSILYWVEQCIEYIRLNNKLIVLKAFVM